MAIEQMFVDLINALEERKRQLRNENGSIGRYAALSLSDVEKAHAVYMQHVSERQETDDTV